MLHSRDAEISQFNEPSRRLAREQLLPVAEELERAMRSMAEMFVSEISPQMAEVVQLCSTTPCGGLSWELTQAANEEEIQKKVSGRDTPCGRLHRANKQFIELAYSTRADAALGARAASLLRLPRGEFQMRDLTHVVQDG